MTEDVATVRPSSGIFVDIGSWLMGKRDHSFRSWRKRMPKKKVSSSSSPPPATSNSSVSDPQPSTSSNSMDQPEQQVPTRSKVSIRTVNAIII